MKKKEKAISGNRKQEGFLRGSRKAVGAQLLCIILSFLMIFTTSGTAFAQAVNAAQDTATPTASSATPAETTTPTATGSSQATSAAVEAGNETELRQALKTGDSNIKLTADITLGKELELNGSGTTIDLNGKTISGNNKTRLFTMAENSSATVKNGTLKDGNATGDGGAGEIKTSAKLNIEGCTIEGNNASGSGGAMSVARGATITINGCTFKDNEAKRTAAR